MLKEGLFFSNYSSYGFNVGSYWAIMVADMCRALTDCGVPTKVAVVTDGASLAGAVNAAIQTPPLFVGTFNFATPFQLVVGDEPIWVGEPLVCRAVTIFLDHPVHMVAEIVACEARARLTRYRLTLPPLPLYGIMENGHREFLNDMGIADDRIVVVPQGAPEPDGVVLPLLADRPIPMLFTGTVSPLETEDAFLSVVGDGAAARAALLKVVEVALSNGDSYAAAKREYSRLGSRPDPQMWANVAKLADIRARALRRRALLLRFKDMPVHFCGTIDEEFARQFPLGVFHGNRSFEDVLKIKRQARMLLNDTINLRDGLLIRAYYAMAQGCVLVTERNTFVEREFVDGTDAILLDSAPEDTARIMSLLSDVDKLQAISNSGQATLARHHRWTERVKDLADVLTRG
jgi:hypothetical protein